MKKKFVSLMTALVICLGAAIPASASSGCGDVHIKRVSTGYCSGDGVNIRTGPGTGYSSLGMLFSGDRLIAYQCERTSSEWVHVHNGSVGGWISAQYYTATSFDRVPVEPNALK